MKCLSALSFCFIYIKNANKHFDFHLVINVNFFAPSPRWWSRSTVSGRVAAVRCASEAGENFFAQLYQSTFTLIKNFSFLSTPTLRLKSASWSFSRKCKSSILITFTEVRINPAWFESTSWCNLIGKMFQKRFSHCSSGVFSTHTSVERESTERTLKQMNFHERAL